ncbi:MAG: hypothetical protein ACKV2T_41085, partial [Kofleriaceae bacterium]
GDIDSSDMNCSGNDDDEQPASSAIESVEPAWTGVGSPNAGFLRDDALLVVVAITDEDEQPRPGANAHEIYDRLVAVKGDVNKLVFLGIGGASSCGNGTYGAAKHAEKLEDVANLFIAQQHGVFWDLCQGNLEQGLAQALATIDTACEQFPTIF